MAFDWKSVRRQADRGAQFACLLDQMNRTRATRDDLLEAADFLIRLDLGRTAWRAIGEGLYRSTGGAAPGFQVWCDWTRSLGGQQYDEGDQLATWYSFSELPPVPVQADEPETLQLDEDGDFTAGPTRVDELYVAAPESMDEWEIDVATRVAPPIDDLPAPGLLQQSAYELMTYVPEGPFDVRLFGQAYAGVDEYKLLALLRRGLFLGLEVRLGERWVPAVMHPAFGTLGEQLVAEAHGVLTEPAPPQWENTVPEMRR